MAKKSFFRIMAIMVTGLVCLGACQKENKGNDPAGKIWEEDGRQKETMVTGEPARVDLTAAAETAVHAVVHIKATQTGKTRIVEERTSLWYYYCGNGSG